MARLYKRNVSGSVTMLPGTELRPVSFNRRPRNEEAMARACFHNVCQFPYGKHCFQGQLILLLLFFFSRCKLCLPYTVGNFNENPSMRARAGEHSF